MRAVTPERDQQNLQETGGARFAFAYGAKGKLVANISRNRGDISMTLKLVPPLKTLKELELPQVVHKMASAQSGLILIKTAAGQGRTSILNTLVDDINDKAKKQISMISDALEHYHSPKKSTFLDSQIGNDALTLSDAARSAIDHGSDVICIDSNSSTGTEIVKATMQAVQAGSLVIVTQCEKAYGHPMKLFNPGDCGTLESEVDYIQDVFLNAYIGTIGQHIDFASQDVRAQTQSKQGSSNHVHAKWLPPEYGNS